MSTVRAKRFFAWLEQQDFSSKASPEDEGVRKQDTAKRTPKKKQQLLYGLRAFNAILTTVGQPPVKRDYMDNLSKELAEQEVELMHDASARRVTPRMFFTMPFGLETDSHGINGTGENHPSTPKPWQRFS